MVNGEDVRFSMKCQTLSSRLMIGLWVMAIALVVGLAGLPQQSEALVICTPTDCTPPNCGPACESSCTSSCDYRACDGTATKSIFMDHIPLTLAAASSDNACADNPQDVNQLPFTHQGVPYNAIQTNITHVYSICKTHTKDQTFTGGPCPP